MYLEERPANASPQQAQADTDSGKDEPPAHSQCVETGLETSVAFPPRKSYLEQCRIFGKTDPDTAILMMMVRIIETLTT